MIKRHLSILTYTFLIAPLFVLDLLLLFFFIDYYGLRPEIGAVISFLLTGLLGYAFERYFIFKSQERDFRSGFVLYLSIVIVGALLVYIGMMLLTEVFMVHFLIARIAVATLSGAWDYFMNFYINFQVHKKEAVPELSQV